MTTITIERNNHRFDSVLQPEIVIGGYGSFPQLNLGERLYLRMTSPVYVFDAPNRTENLKAEVRDLYLSEFETSDGITNAANTFTKTDSEGFTGATATEVDDGDCSIEGVPGWIYGSTIFALQSGTPDFDYYYGDEVEHALVFNQDGFGFINERGVRKKEFIWEIGDRGLVELVSGIVRYYQVKPDGTKILLRGVRSLLTYPVTPTVVLYHVGAIAEDVLVWEGSGASAQLQTYGVLEEFQDWQNQAGWESLADKTMTKDKREDFTYFSEMKNLMTLSLNIAWDESEAYGTFLEFYKFHDISREFIFVDNARHTEYFAQFVSSFKDNPLGGEIFGMSVDIRQMIDPPLLPVKREPVIVMNGDAIVMNGDAIVII